MFLKNINTLWSVYLVAICLIASVITLFFVISEYQQQQGISNERIVNIAGRQRMLSQRLALFTNLYVSKGDEVYKTIVIGDLDIFEKSHKALVYGSDELGIPDKAGKIARDIYFGDINLDGMVGEYISHIRTILNGGSVQDELLAVNDMAQSNLLRYLDDVVNAVEVASYQENENLIFYERVFYILAMILLLAEIIFIYRPSFLFIKKYDRDLREEQARLEANNKELEQFAYRTSHDFRSPIISCVSLLGICKKFIQDGDYKSLETSIDMVIKSLRGLEHLINEVITITLTQKQKEESEVFDVKVLVEDTLADMTGFEGDGEIEFVNECKPITLETKRRHLRIVLFNLLTNSIKYRDPDKNSSYVKISAEQNGNDVIITVRDNGLGIPEDYQHKMFEMFQRFHPKVSYGSGLGLHIIKTSVTALGGTIEFSQDPDTCFTITIPVKT